MAKLEKSSSTLDLVGDGNIPALAQETEKVLYEELIIDLGVEGRKNQRLSPIYCELYRLPPTPYTPAQEVLVVSPIPMVSKLDFDKYCDRNNFVNICRERSPPG